MSGGSGWYMNRNRPQLQAEQNPLSMQVAQPQSVANTMAAQFNQPETQPKESEPEAVDENDLLKLLQKYWSALV